MMKASTRLDSSQTAVLHKQRRRRGSPEMNKGKVSASLCHEGNKEDSDKYSKRTVMVVLLVIISSTSEQLDDNRITIFTLRLLEQTQSFSFSSFILLLSSQTAGLGSLSLVISSLNWCSSLLTSHADTGGSLCGKLPLLPRFQRS
ncbi:hypothetical protein DY000_02055994 [Brassica cretica]|uniref:Uncharacterized protein n=1 Tax=Brassica cretica TaxID=69181 RepID=A0ABQ7AKJ3_BRACR|nr:hypothetical protein DY000_02055994 [Brassica cretica]